MGVNTKTVFNRLLLFFLMGIVVSVSACKKDDDPQVCETPTTPKGKLRLKFNGKLGSEELVLGQIYTDPSGNIFKPETMKFYVSDIALITEQDEKVPFSEVELIDFISVSGQEYTYDVPEGNYKGVMMGLGLSNELNASDPVDFSDTHPLGLGGSMYWTWATRYIFFKYDGRIDTLQNGSFDHFYIYHVGHDDFFSADRFFSTNFSIVENETSEFNIKVDLERVLYNPSDTINFITDDVTHTNNNFTLAQRFRDNFIDAFSP